MTDTDRTGLLAGLLAGIAGEVPSSPPAVMAGLVPAIHVSRHRGARGEGARRRPDVDTRNKSGHDGGGKAGAGSPLHGSPL